MSKNHSEMMAWVGIFTAVLIAAIWFQFSATPPTKKRPEERAIARASPEKRIYASVDVKRLTHDKDIVGSWKRVACPEDKDDDIYGWRQMNAAGKMATLYGDVIYEGSYKLIDKKTIETTYHIYGKDDETNLWTYGFLDGKLIMINNERGWVEAYESVPAGTLHPSLGP